MVYRWGIYTLINEWYIKVNLPKFYYKLLTMLIQYEYWIFYNFNDDKTKAIISFD